MRSLLSIVIFLALFAAACGSDAKFEIPEAPDAGRLHVAVGQPHSPYTTTPATSGPHWSTTPAPGAPHGAPARWGIYSEVLPDEVLVHNLEHGGIGLHYNCPSGCPEIVAALSALVPPGASQFIVSPYPGAPARVAVTAWRRLMLLDTADSERIKTFISNYQDKAPESIKVNLF